MWARDRVYRQTVHDDPPGCVGPSCAGWRNTTKRTNVLVIGEMDPARLRPGMSLSGKARKAALLQEAGQDIELMTEADFLEHIAGGQVR